MGNMLALGHRVRLDWRDLFDKALWQGWHPLGAGVCTLWCVVIVEDSGAKHSSLGRMAESPSTSLVSVLVHGQHTWLLQSKSFGVGRSRKGGSVLLEGFAFLHCCWIANGEISVILYHIKNAWHEFPSPTAGYAWFKFSYPGFLVKIYSIFNLTFPKSERIWYFLAHLCLCPHNLRWKRRLGKLYGMESGDHRKIIC